MNSYADTLRQTLLPWHFLVFSMALRDKKNVVVNVLFYKALQFLRQIIPQQVQELYDSCCRLFDIEAWVLSFLKPIK